MILQGSFIYHFTAEGGTLKFKLVPLNPADTGRQLDVRKAFDS